MISRTLISLAAAAVLACGSLARADDSIAGRPITSVYGLEAGAANISCDYLSPLPYAGAGFAWYGGWGKEMKQSPEHLVMAFRGGIDFTRTSNPSRSANMVSLAARFGWGPSWRHRFPGPNLELTIGGALDIYGGVLWLPVNGNNPAQALAYAGLDLTAGLSWKTHFGRLPVTIADRAWLPTAGTFFCPEYGQTYYEIYLGERSGLAHFGWWGNAFGIDNHLTMTLHFRNRRSLVIGYRLATRTFHANHLTTQYVRNAFTVALQIN